MCEFASCFLKYLFGMILFWMWKLHGLCLCDWVYNSYSTNNIQKYIYKFVVIITYQYKKECSYNITMVLAGCRASFVGSQSRNNLYNIMCVGKYNVIPIVCFELLKLVIFLSCMVSVFVDISELTTEYGYGWCLYVIP